MSEERFDVIVVGAGMAGNAAAYALAKAGLEVLVVERGNAPGAKNVTGGRMYGHAMERLIPGFAQEAPIERKIARERLTLATADGGMTIEYGSEYLKDPKRASYSILRSKFDPWLAGKAEELGAMYVPGIRVDDLLVRDGKVCGVVAGGEEMEADAVILADGVNSLLAQKLGMKKEILPSQVAVGAKEVIHLGEDVIDSRFAVEPGEGVAWLIAGDPTGGNIGGGFLYTDRDCVSVGLVTTVGDLGHSDLSVPEMVDRLKEHPAVKPYLAGGKTVEYSAHLVTEGGFDMMPELCRDGVLVAGDAAALVLNLGFTIRGMDFAIESGRLAADAIIRAKERGDFSAASLSGYKTALEQSFVMPDMEHYRKLPAFIENHRIFNEYPEMMDKVMKAMYVVDGAPPKRITKKAKGALKPIGLMNLAKDGMKGLGAL